MASRTFDQNYARKVVDGKILACEWVRLACQRHIDDLDRPDFPYAFDVALANRAINFIQLLPHTKGRWAAKRELLKLEPWQRFIIGSLFGWVHKKTGLRRFREAYIEVARKNGKSILAAAIGVYMLVADSEYGAEVYAGATTEKQAWQVFGPARLMCKNTPELTEFYDLEVNASNLVRLEDNSKMEPLIGNPGDGPSPSCALVDEYHEHKSTDLFETMQTGMGAREQPLLAVITTAGSNMGGPCYEKRGEASKILQGTFKDDQFFAIIYTLDKGDDWKKQRNWIKANPNMGVSVNKDYLKAQIASATRNPSKQSGVKTKNLNVWVGAKEAWVNMEQWADGADSKLKESDFYGLHCVQSLDLATKIDIAARIRVFTRYENGDDLHYYVFPKFYLPEGALESAKNASIYRGWAAAGHLELMDGEEISYAQVQEDVEKSASTHRVDEIVYDPWQATQMAQALREKNLLAVEYRNTTANMSFAMLELEGALASGRLHHTNNPVLNWMASNVVAKKDANDNVFPRKELPENKIDGMVGLIMGVGRAMHQENTGSLDDFLGSIA